MQITVHPIIAALRKHKAGAALIALQIAFTLAIVCNAIFIIGKRFERIGRSTGLNEDSLFWVSQQWVGAYDTATPDGVAKLDAMQQEDIEALRSMPDVASASSLSTLPLLNYSRDAGINLVPGQQESAARTVFYFGDDETLSALGLKLIAGRSFDSGDVIHQAASDPSKPTIVIITKDLAEKLFPGQSAVGKAIFFDGGSRPATIVGIVQQLQVSTTHSWADSFLWNSTLVPVRLDANTSTYAVRAKPGRMLQAMKATPAALYRVTPMRVLNSQSVKSFADIRADAYRDDIGMAIMMGVICVVLISVTAAGIVGLSSFWVSQRYKQIGIRRALGARKIDILNYFHLENLIIAGAGAVLGVILAIGLNVWLITHYEMNRIPVRYVLSGVVIVLILAQIAVFSPARRASNVPPLAATRPATRR